MALITREQAEAYLGRWKAVEEFELREVQSQTVIARWHELAHIIERAVHLNLWQERVDDNIAIARQNWSKLKIRYGEIIQ